jgi:formylglycine-generating enzyme required for sulfatase activity
VQLYRPNGRNVVYIDYILDGAPAIVTAEVYSPDGALGLSRASSVSGDVSRVVGVGNGRIVWNAAADYPDRIITNAHVKVKAWATNAPPDYLAVDLSSSNNEDSLRWYDSAENVPGGITNDVYKTAKLLMRKIPAAGVTWMMGSPVVPTAENNRNAYTETPHYVTLTKDYYIGVYPVTAGQYERVVGSLPAGADVEAEPVPSDAELHPVSGVSYGWQGDDIPHYLRYSYWPERKGHDVDGTGFLGLLSKRTAVEFDLPTSAQWEFACRAGSDGAVYGGYSVADVAWCKAETNRTVAVGLKKPNAYNLYDMLGNVWEWCLDMYPSSPAATPVADEHQIDPAGITYEQSGYTANNQIKRYRRGGNYTSEESEIRVAYSAGRKADGRDPMLGFRVVCPAVAR